MRLTINNKTKYFGAVKRKNLLKLIADLIEFSKSAKTTIQK